MSKLISATNWSSDFISDLPDSSFAWVEAEGKKDSGGKTIPRSLRHLPFKNESGKVNLPYLRNSLAKLPQIENMTPSIRNSVKKRLQNVLENSKISNPQVREPKQVGKLEASYVTGFEAKIVEAGGKKKVALTGILMDDSINKNGWRVTKGHEILAKEFIGIPIKMQHMKSDWEIVGTGVSAEVESNKVFYNANITDPDAVLKFETNTWNIHNMGISPTFNFEHIACSICNEQLESLYGHEHTPNKIYNGTKCFYDVMNPHLVEASLTSTPAYKPTAGTIDTAQLCASLNKILNFNNINMEEKSMTKNATDESFEAIVLEKDTKIETLQSSLNDKDTKIKELESSVTDNTEKVKEFETSNNELKEKLSEYVVATRKVELEKRLQDKELIAELLKKEMTNEEFTAELVKIEKIQASIPPKNAKGTVPSSDSAINSEVEINKIGASMFGTNWKELAGIKSGGAE